MAEEGEKVDAAPVVEELHAEDPKRFGRTTYTWEDACTLHTYYTQAPTKKTVVYEVGEPDADGKRKTETKEITREVKHNFKNEEEFQQFLKDLVWTKEHKTKDTKAEEAKVYDGFDWQKDVQKCSKGFDLVGPEKQVEVEGEEGIMNYEALICPKCKDKIGKIETVWRCKEVGCCGETYHDQNSCKHKKLPLDEQDDIIDGPDNVAWEEYDEEIALKEKLGLKKHRYIQKEKHKMDQAEKDKFDENEKLNKEHRKKADEIIAKATEEANAARKALEDERKNVQQLEKDNAKAQEELLYEQGGEKRIDDDFKKTIKDMRTKQLGEIYWTMKEAMEPNAEDKEKYIVAIDNYLLSLYLEDNDDEEDLGKQTANIRQLQIYQHFKKQFRELTNPLKKLPPHEKGQKFAELFPKPEAKAEDKEKYAKAIELYEEHIEKTYGSLEAGEGDGGGILVDAEGGSVMGGSMSAAGGSGAGGSQVKNEEKKVKIDEIIAIDDADEQE